MKKIKEFIYNNKKNILLFILATLGLICLANCNIPKAKAAAAITDLNQLWGNTYEVNKQLEYRSGLLEASITSTNTDICDLNKLYIKTKYIIMWVNNRPVYNFISDSSSDCSSLFKFSIGYSTDNETEINGSNDYNYWFNFSGVDFLSQVKTDENLLFSIKPDGTTIWADWVGDSVIIKFNVQPPAIEFYLGTNANSLNSFNTYITPVPVSTKNNLNIYVNDILAYNDSIEFNTGNPVIQYIYSNYSKNQIEFINNLANPLKYTANEFIANVFNVSNNTTTASIIDFAFTGNYLVGVSYDYINTSGELVRNSYGLSPDDEDSLRLLMFTNLERNDTDINIRITTNNLNDFESGAVNSAFKTIFGFFNEIISIQFGFITLGQILGFILAIAIIGLIYKVWNGGNND